MAKATAPTLPLMGWIERHRQAATYGGIILGLLLVGIVAIAVTPAPAWGAASGLPGHPIALLIDPADGQTLFVGTEAGKIYGSGDNGQTWVDRSTGLPAKIAVSALLRSTDDAHFFAGTSAGVFVYDTAAQHWANSSSGLPAGDGVDALAFAGVNGAVLLAGTELHGIYRSTDGGKTWTAATGLPAGADVYGLTTLPDNQTLYAALIGAGLFRSSDGGLTWAAANSGIPPKTDAFAVAPLIDAKGAVTALVAGTSVGAYRSIDGGKTWAAANTGLPKTRVISLAVDPRQAQQMVAGTDAGAFITINGGATWVTLAQGLPGGQHVGLVALNSKGTTVIYAAVEGLYRYPAAGTPVSAVVGRVAFVGIFITIFVWISSRQRRIMRAMTPTLPEHLQRPGVAGRLPSVNRPKPTYQSGVGHIRGGPPPRASTDAPADEANDA